eukprot:364938-Chlamydomonas_euryale.AAC.7
MRTHSLVKTNDSNNPQYTLHSPSNLPRVPARPAAPSAASAQCCFLHRRIALAAHERFPCRSCAGGARIVSTQGTPIASAASAPRDIGASRLVLSVAVAFACARRCVAAATRSASSVYSATAYAPKRFLRLRLAGPAAGHGQIPLRHGPRPAGGIQGKPEDQDATPAC